MAKQEFFNILADRLRNTTLDDAIEQQMWAEESYGECLAERKMESFANGYGGQLHADDYPAYPTTHPLIAEVEAKAAEIDAWVRDFISKHKVEVEESEECPF
jgi:hypothetical protein